MDARDAWWLVVEGREAKPLKSTKRAAIVSVRGMFKFIYVKPVK